MIVSVIFILVSICFCIVVKKSSQTPPAYKTEKIANAINNVLLISPIIATITFLVRYCTLMFSSIHQITYLLGGFMIILWYVINLKYDDKKIFRK